MVRILERRQRLAAIGSAGRLEESIQQREPERALTAIAVGVAHELHEPAHRTRPYRTRRHELDEPCEERALLIDVVALGLACAGPLLERREKPLGLIAPRRLFPIRLRHDRFVAAPQLQPLLVQPSRLRCLPVRLELSGTQHPRWSYGGRVD